MNALKKILWLATPALIVTGTMLILPHLFHGAGVVIVIALVPTAIVATFVVFEGFFVRDDYLARWTKSHGITITDENRDVLLRYLRRGRRIRTAGGLLGYTTYALVVVLIGEDKVGVGWLRATFGGYLLGAAVAELWAFRTQPGAPRAAALAPRGINDYVPRYAVALTRLVPAAIVAFAAGWEFIPRGVPFPGDGPRPDFGEGLVWTGVAVVLAILVEATARRIVHRPQPVSSEALVEADDAIRTTAMHGLVGAGLALQLGILSRLSGRWLDFTSGGAWHAALTSIWILAGFAAVFAWLRLGIDQEWVVRRVRRRQEATA